MSTKFNLTWRALLVVACVWCSMSGTVTAQQARDFWARSETTLRSGPGWPALEQAVVAPSARVGVDDVAVIVAVENYANLPGIQGARSNGLAWSRYLNRAMRLPKARITLLLDAEAQQWRIKKVIRERREQMRPGGRFWFIFIGHGAPSRQTRDDGRNDGLLVGYDASASPEGLEHGSVQRSELVKLLGEIPVKGAETVVVLDACFSGRTERGEIVPNLQPVAIVDRAAPASVIVLTAASGNEFAGALPGANRPAFSYLVLGAMRGWGDSDQNGNVTAREAIDYASETLVAVLRGERSQHPTLDGSATGLVLGTGAEAAPDYSPEVSRGDSQPPSRARASYGALGGPVAAANEPSTSSPSISRPVSDAPIHGDGGSGKALTVTSIALAAAGGVTAAVGVGLWSSANSTIEEIEMQCPTRMGCSSALQRDYDAAKSRAEIGNYLVPIGAAVFGVGAVLYLIDKSNNKRSLSTMSFRTDPSGASVQFRGRL